MPFGVAVAGVSYLTYEKLAALGVLPVKGCCEAKKKKVCSVLNRFINLSLITFFKHRTLL